MPPQVLAEWRRLGYSETMAWSDKNGRTFNVVDEFDRQWMTADRSLSNWWLTEPASFVPPRTNNGVFRVLASLLLNWFVMNTTSSFQPKMEIWDRPPTVGEHAAHAKPRPESHMRELRDEADPGKPCVGVRRLGARFSTICKFAILFYVFPVSPGWFPN